MLPLWQLFIALCLTSLLAGCVGGYLGRAFASSRLSKRVSELETESAIQASEFAKVLALSKRISQRVALDQHRTMRGASTVTPTSEPPPPGDKAAAKAFYLRGKSHTEVARMALRSSNDA